MKAEVLIPDFVWDQTNYYVRLQEQAMFYQKGDFDGLEEAMNDAEITRIKNARLMPMYAEIVGLVKHLTNNDETTLIKEFNHAKHLIENKNLSIKETEDQINKLREAYRNIIDKALEEGDQTQSKINKTQEQLLILYNILKLWESYLELHFILTLDILT
jgi:hypothetical protein